MLVRCLAGRGRLLDVGMRALSDRVVAVLARERGRAADRTAYRGKSSNGVGPTHSPRTEQATPSCLNLTETSATYIAERAAPAESGGLTPVLHRFEDELHMPKVVQVRTAIALQCPCVPMDIDLMDRDAGDRSGSGRLVAILADPDDAVA